MSAPCECARPGLARRMGRLAEWSAPVIPAAALALLPKCPACIAAYAALWSGIGLSLTAAAQVRTGLLLITLALVAIPLARGWHRRRLSKSQGKSQGIAP